MVSFSSGPDAVEPPQPVNNAHSRTVYRKRTLSLSSICSTQSRIILDYTTGDRAVRPSVHPSAQDAYGSFIPTSSACDSLQHLRDVNNIHPPLLKLVFRSYRKRPRQWSDDDSSASDPPSPVVPTFSRSPMSEGLLPSATVTVVHRRPLPQHSTTDLNPILARLEKKSKLCSKRVSCSTCNKPGFDYPKCGRCNAMWCSRECRVYGGKKHVCNRTTSE